MAVSGIQQILCSLANEPYSGIGEDNFYNNDRTAGVNYAKYSCRMLPNVNQMAWYISNGDPRWDGEEIWTSMGHLHKGGMWLLKKSYIPLMSEFRAPAPYNRDMRQDDFSQLNRVLLHIRAATFSFLLWDNTLGVVSMA